MVSIPLAQFLLLLLAVILPVTRTISLTAEPNHQRKLKSSRKNSRMPGPKESPPPQLLFLPTQDKGTDQYIAYHFKPGSTNAEDDDKPVSPVIVFCGGFRSDMTGRKAMALEQHCQQQPKGRPYLRFDYRGHGQSSGTDCFAHWTLADWIYDTVAVVNHLVANGRPQQVILVGSSMGAWIALHVAQLLPELVVGVVTIAAAPDFTKDLLEQVRQEEASWKELQSTGVSHRPSLYSPTDQPYPISQRLLEDAKQWYLLEPTNSNDNDDNDKSNSRISLHCPVHLLHGEQDVDVSFQKSLDLAKHLSSSSSNDDNNPPPHVAVTLLPHGDHRLSTPQDLVYILAAVDTMCQLVAL